jgi:hypothetical protein
LPDGVTHSQSSRWQRVASLDDATFEAALARAEAAGEPVTTAGLVQIRG